MKTMKKVMAFTASSCMALVALTGCSSGSKDATNEIKFGFNFELSGEVANYGTPEFNAAKLAIKIQNEKTDAKYKYTYVEGDNKSTAEESTNVATKMITSDKVNAIIGPATSGASAAIYQIASDNKVFVMSPSATATNVTLADGKSVDSLYPYVYRVCFEDSYQGAAMASYATDTLKKSKAVIISDSSSDYAKGLAKAFDEKFTSNGGSIVTEVNYQAKDKDFNSQLTKIKGMDYDVIYIPGYYSEVGLIISQARSMGITTPIIGGDGFDSTKLVELAGANNLNDVYFTTAYSTVGASAELQAFIEAYKKEYNEDPGMFAALAYDSVTTMIQTYENAASKEVADVQAYLNKVEYKGVTGSFSFDEKHTPKKSALVVQLKDGVQTDAVEVDPNK